MGFGKRSTEHREILRENVNQPPVDQPVPRHHTVSQHLLFVESKIGRTVRYEAVEFDEGAGVQQQVETFSGCELSLFVLFPDPVGAAAQFGLLAEFLQCVELVVNAHDRCGCSLVAMRKPEARRLARNLAHYAFRS